jgi:hypothetical protein
MGLTNSAERAPQHVRVGAAGARRKPGNSVVLVVKCFPLGSPHLKVFGFVYDIESDPSENAINFGYQITRPLALLFDEGIRDNVIMIDVIFQDDYRPTDNFEAFISELRTWAKFPPKAALGILSLTISGRLNTGVVPEHRRLNIYRSIGRIALHFAGRVVHSHERENVLVDKIRKDDRGLVIEDDEIAVAKRALGFVDLNLWD